MLNLNNAVVFDCETFPNCFTLAMERLDSDEKCTWEISFRRDDRQYLMAFFADLARFQTPMIGFNNLNFDYPVIHKLFHNPQMTVEQLYAAAMDIINADPGNRFGNMIWPDNRFAPQIDLYKIHHFDNPAKSTSLKWLQVNMRSESVVDMPVPHGTMLDENQIENYLKPYNVHDTSKTKTFAHYSMEAINFRNSQIDQFGVDVLNWNDTKIGEQTVINRLGPELCYDRSSGRRRMRQTPRQKIALNDIIFPYIQFEHPEFQRVLNYLRQQTLTADEFKENAAPTTKGVFTDLKAHVGGIDFYFGVGGIHGSVKSKRFIATEEYPIKDIDVAALYPNIAIENNLAPAHLGQAFVAIYSELPKERRKWQAEKGKKCVEANALKLASNGVYGKSNSMYSPFYDPQFTMTITVNGQLMLCMLAEQLIKVPTLTLIQINTDGMTYIVHKDYAAHANKIEEWWQGVTRLTLESVFYKRMFIRDVNSYVAEDMKGGLKLKGAYWTPEPMRYHESIGEAQPPAWHKNLSNAVSVRAAVSAMVDGVDPEIYIKFCTNPYDFMCAVKAKGKDQYYHGEMLIQKTVRYYVSVQGAALVKKSPPTGTLGTFKKANGVSDAEYHRVMQETGGAWDARVCTKKKSVHEIRETSAVAGYNVSICNKVQDFDFSNINYDWYVAEAKKLIV